MLLTLISGWASHSSVTLRPHKLMPSALSPFVFSLNLFLLRRCPVLHCSDMAQHNYTVKGTSCSLQEKPVDTESSISSSISSHCGVHYRKQLKPSSSVISSHLPPPTASNDVIKGIYLQQTVSSNTDRGEKRGGKPLFRKAPVWSWLISKHTEQLYQCWRNAHTQPKLPHS